MLEAPVEQLLPAGLHAKPMSTSTPLFGRRKDDTKFPIHISLNPILIDDQTYVLAAVRDITKIEQVRQSQRRNEQRLRTLLEQLPDAVAVYRHGRFVMVNATLCENLGYDEPDEVIGEPLLKFIHSDDRQMARKRVEQMLESGEKLPPANMRFFRRDGELLTIEAHDQPIVFEGEPAFVVIGRDVTDKQKLLARAMQLDRKLAVGTLATGVAHEINNPLSYAKANVEFVLRGISKAASLGSERIDAEMLSDMVDALSDSSRGLERIAVIVDDLETFVDHHGGGLAEVDVESVLEASLNLVFRQLDSKAHVVRELRDLPKVRANRGQLAEVFINLLTNALLTNDLLAGDIQTSEQRHADQRPMISDQRPLVSDQRPANQRRAHWRPADQRPADSRPTT